MFKVEKVKEFKIINNKILESLQQAIKECFDSNDDESSLEDYEFAFEVDGISFSLINKGSNEWEDDGRGKYFSNTDTYQLVSFDVSEISYPCECNIIDYYNLIVSQDCTRTGSYYTEWYYQYDEPQILMIGIKTIPEVTIPEHEEVVLKTLEK